MSPAFSSASLSGITPTVKIYLKKIVQGIKDNSMDNGIVDLNHWFNNFTLDVVGALAIGADLSALQSPEPHPYVQNTLKVFKAAALLFQLPWLANIFLKIPNAAVTKDRAKLTEFTTSSIEKKLAEGEHIGHKTLLWVLANSQDPLTGQKLTKEELMVNCKMSAGSHTTASTTTFLMFFMLQDSARWDRLVKEIRGAIKSFDQITNAAISKLPYLDAVVFESLRMAPAHPIGNRRITPPEGAVIGGLQIAGHTYVSVPSWVVHRDKNVFSNPDSFIPERWISDIETCQKSAILSFSHGPLGCLGRSLAIMEMKMAVVALVLEFDLKFAPKARSSPLFEMGLFLNPGSLTVEAKPRNSDLE